MTTRIPPALMTTPPALVLLGQQVANNVASLNFTGWRNDALYENYVFELTDFTPVTDNTPLNIRSSTDGGASWDAGTGYTYSLVTTVNGSATVAAINGTGVSSILLKPLTDWGSAAGESMFAKIQLMNPAGTTKNKLFMIDAFGANAAATAEYQHLKGTGVRLATADIDGLQFFYSIGNISTGTGRVYGVRKQ